MIKTISAIVLVSSACLFAQPASQKIVDSSVLVGGFVEQNGKMQASWVGGGIILDPTHVVTTSGCCNKTDQGVEKKSVVVQGNNSVVAKVAWAGAGLLVILELEKPLQGSAVTVAPLKLTTQNQPGYTVQYPKDAQPTLVETKILASFAVDDPKIQAYKAQPAPESVLQGGGLFNACGQVMGINLLVKDGTQFAVVIDELRAGIEKTGLQVAVTDAACGGGAQTSGNEPPPQQAPPPGQAPPPQQAPPPGQAPPPQQAPPAATPAPKGGDGGGLPFGLRMPQGGEWIGVAIIAAILGAALRSGTRQQVARAFTGRRQPVPQPYPYPQPQMPPQPYPYPQPQAYVAPPVPVMRQTKPVLHGIAGKYAGASVSLESGPSLLGRDQASANLVFPPDSDSVSKRHCTVRWDAARSVFVLEDLGSTNGTFLANGERLAPNQPRDLRPGEKFYIGDMRNQFEVRMEE